MVQYTAAMVLSVAVLCSMTLLSQASPVDWWKSEFAREEEKEILEEVAAHIISELESEMMIQQDEECLQSTFQYRMHAVLTEQFRRVTDGDTGQAEFIFNNLLDFTCNSSYSLFVSKNGGKFEEVTNPASITYTCDLDDRSYQSSIQKKGEPRCAIPCMELQSIQNGAVSVKGNQPPLENDTAKYSCDSGYQLSGTETRTCGEDGEWSGQEPSCKSIPQCPELQEIANGDVNYTSRQPGANATYSCNSGYVLQGAETRTCGQDRKWSGQEPRCVPLCPVLVAPPNGAVNYGDRKPGDVATYSCRDGYRLVGPEMRICARDQDGKWSGIHPVCEIIILCSLVDPIPNGDMSADKNPIPGRGYPVDTVVTYTCDNGYLLWGEDTRICLRSGEWDHPEPSCRPLIVCPLVNPIPHGGMNADRSPVPGTGGRYPVDTVITYTCDNGYLLWGENTRKCLRSGEWDHPEPSCEPRIPLLCPELPDIANGAVNYSSREPGATASYSCNNQGDKFKLSGTTVRRCIQVSENEARWSGEEPKCIPLCPELPDIANGAVSYSSRKPGATANYSCNNQGDKFTLNGTTTRKCTKVSENKARWSGEEPKCIPLCPELLPIPFGSVTFHDRKPGDIARYGCIGDQFQIEGNDMRICGEEGEWLGPVPTCVPLICPPVGLNIPNGESNTSRGPVEGPGGSRGYGVGTVITYACGEDYELRGERERTCILPEGGEPEWDHEPPRCDVRLCPELPAPLNGAVNYGNREPGDVANYTCRYGYQLVGSEMRICVRDQDGIPKWSGKPPVCEIIICPSDSLPITNGEFSPSSGGRRGFVVGTVVHYTCTSDRFELRGESRRTCLESGEWDHPRPSCVAVKCPKLDLKGIPNSVEEIRRQLERDRPKNYVELLKSPFFEKKITGNLVPYDEGSTAHLTCIHRDGNGWTLMPNSPSVQTCVRNSTNGELYWTEPGICVYRYSITKPALTGGTG